MLALSEQHQHKNTMFDRRGAKKRSKMCWRKKNGETGLRLPLLSVRVESSDSLHSTIMAIFEFKFELKLELHNFFSELLSALSIMIWDFQV